MRGGLLWIIKATLKSVRERAGFSKLLKNKLRQIVPKFAVEVRNSVFGAFAACFFEAALVGSRKLLFGEFFGIKKYDKKRLQAGARVGLGGGCFNRFFPVVKK